MAELISPRRAFARLYRYTITLLGLAVIALAVYRGAAEATPPYWLILFALTALTGLFSVKVPGVASNISIADTLIFTNVILFGSGAGALTAAVDALAVSIRFPNLKRRVEYILFNMGAMALSIFLAGESFFGLLGRPPLYHPPKATLGEIIVPIAVLALVHYVANSGSVALILALEYRRSLYRVWRENFLFVSMTYVTGAAVAALIALNVDAITPAFLGVVIPILLVIYFVYRTHLDKAAGVIRHLQELNRLYLSTVESLALAVDAKDSTTYGHIRRVRAYSLGLAKLHGISDPNELLGIETGALLHDIGKLAIDDYILNKPGRLTKAEFEKMKMHAPAGYEILAQIDFPFPVAKYVRHHHERWDGTGYPDGLKEEEIPIGARILSIADAYDAIRSSRPYKDTVDVENSIGLIRAQVGKMYDPRLVDLFAKHIEELDAAAQEAGKNIPELSFRKSMDELDRAIAESEKRQPVPAPSADSATELAALFEFCTTLGKHFALPDILAHLERRLRRLVPVTTCVFFLDRGDGVLQAAHAGGKFAAEMRKIRTELGKGISGWAAAYQRSIVNTGPSLELKGLEGDFSSLTDALVVPLLSGAGAIGTIALFAEHPIFYTRTHLVLMEMVARQAAPLIADALGRNGSRESADVVDPATAAHRASYLPVAGARMVASAEAAESSFSLFYVECKSAAQASKLYGLSATDAYVRRVADALREELRETDVVVRFGLDAFVVLLAAVRREQAPGRAQRFEQLVRSVPVNPAGKSGGLQCAIGHASYPDDAKDVFALLDTARQQALGAAREERADAGDPGGSVIEFPMQI